MTQSDADGRGSSESSRWQSTGTVSSEVAEDSSEDSSDWEDHGDVEGAGELALPAGRGNNASSVYVQQSRDVHLGQRTEYHAPVTINQHVHVSKTESLSPEDLQQEALKSPGLHTNSFVRHECGSPLPEKEGHRAPVPCRSQPLFWGLLGAAALLSLTAVITVYSLPSRDVLTPGPGQPRYLPDIFPSDDPDNPNRTLSNSRRIFSKQEWGGYDARAIHRLVHPTKYVVISHTAGRSCFDSKNCAYVVRNIQDLFMADPAYDDIGYNFLIGGDGNVYEGRGWDAMSMHPGFVKNNNIAICCIGHFVKDSPTYAQMESVQNLLQLGVELGKLDTNYKLVAHNQTYNTLSPGPSIYRIISKWPHFYVPSANDPAK